MTNILRNKIGGFLGLYQLETRSVVCIDDFGNEVLSEPTVIAPWFGNVITDAGLNLLGSSSADNLRYCRIGTGTTPAEETDTLLGTQVGYSETTGVGSDAGAGPSDAYLFRRRSVRFAAGAVSGHVLSEVGMSATPTDSLFSRSLIKDGAGTPFTFTLPVDQYLDVIYELRCYLDLSDTVIVEMIDGVETTITLRKHGTFANASWIQFASVLGRGLWYTFNANNRRTTYCGETQPAQASEPWWRGSDFLIPTRNYVADSHQVTLTFDVPLGQYNFPTGLGYVTIAMSDLGLTSQNGVWSWGFSPKLNKTETRLATIVVGLSWGRYTPP